MKNLSTTEYRSLTQISGPLLFVKNMGKPAYGSIVEIILPDETKKLGQIIDASEEICVIQVFEETLGLELKNTRIRIKEEGLTIDLSPDVLGRVLDGKARPLDNLPPLLPKERRIILGSAINPFSRDNPAEFIQTGISSIDGLNTLVRGQKLPIFSLAGLAANRLVCQIVKQARVNPALSESESSMNGRKGGVKESEGFAVVFAGMGIPQREADYFLENFSSSSTMSRTVVFLNRANDPAIERLLTPRCALTCAEYLAFELGMQVLVILTDMLNYCEALRQVSSSREEVPARRGYPGYMYTDLASIYERAGRIKGKSGSITQIPILTMPSDDITHPIVDLTGYITEGQIVLSRNLQQKGIFPPIDVLPSLSRLMNQGIGKDKTREDHRELSNQLYASYSRGVDLRRLRDIVGEEGLSDLDKKYLKFSDTFEEVFLGQGDTERDIAETLNLGYKILKYLPKEELRRLSRRCIEIYLEQLKDWIWRP